MTVISIDDFEARFDEVMAHVEAGGYAVLMRDGIRVVTLEPIDRSGPERA